MYSQHKDCLYRGVFSVLFQILPVHGGRSLILSKGGLDGLYCACIGITSSIVVSFGLCPVH